MISLTLDTAFDTPERVGQNLNGRRDSSLGERDSRWVARDWEQGCEGMTETE